MKTQREMAFFAPVKRVEFPQPQFVAQDVINSFTCYRDAVIWCWKNRANTEAGNDVDQARCANFLGLHTPHMSRCVNPETKAPMNMNPDYLPKFEAFCGWYAVSQYLAGKAQFTLMEQVIADRKAFA
jgi:hypothetical protein